MDSRAWCGPFRCVWFGRKGSRARRGRRYDAVRLPSGFDAYSARMLLGAAMACQKKKSRSSRAVQADSRAGQSGSADARERCTMKSHSHHTSGAGCRSLFSSPAALQTRNSSCAPLLCVHTRAQPRPATVDPRPNCALRRPVRRLPLEYIDNSPCALPGRIPTLLAYCTYPPQRPVLPCLRDRRV